MTKAPYPLVPTPMRSSWLERHPRWKIPVGLLIFALLLAGFIGIVMTAVTGSFRRSEVYKQSISRAEQSVEVQQRLGTPLTPAWLIAGELREAGDSGEANLSVPISGPKGRGVIRAVAQKSGGAWQFTYLRVNLEGSAGCIDLLSVHPPPEREF